MSVRKTGTLCLGRSCQFVFSPGVSKEGLSLIKVAREGEDTEAISLDIPVKELKVLFVEICENLTKLKEQKKFRYPALPNCALWDEDQRVFIEGASYKGEFC